MIPTMRFNNDSAANYARRSSTNGAADATATGGTDIFNVAETGATQFIVAYVLNQTSQEKILTSLVADRGTSGAGNAPNKAERVGKWVNTSTQINRVDMINTTGTGDFAIGSEIVVLGHD